MMRITSRGTGIIDPERKTPPTQTTHIPITHKPFPKLNPKPDITQKAKVTFLAVLESCLIEMLVNFTARSEIFRVTHP